MRWLNVRAAPARGAKGAKRKPPRRPFALPRRVELGLRIGAIALVFAAAVGAPVWLWRSGTFAAAVGATQRAAVAESARLGLVVNEVVLEGRILAPRHRIAAAVRLKRGDPMLGFDPEAIRTRLIAIPWVREASVERSLPGLVRIRLVERRPVALWQRKGRLAVVDDLGVVITERTRDVARFRDLLIVVGPDAPRHARTVIAMIRSEPLIAGRVSAAVRVGKRRWNIETTDGVRIELPERNPHEAWHRLARLQVREKLLERDLRTIDMRLPDRLIVRPGTPAAGSARTRGKKT
jgi:cell division protein FtsQ